ncbi:NAD(P)-dependent oxidoreductase [bacterium]|nr:MAG: NAD(P)-dependent oxidoreductase [bacterium]
MRIALTGADGRIGRAVRPALLRAGHELHSTDLRTAAPLDACERWSTGNLLDSDHVDRVLEGADAVVHFGGNSNEQPLPQILANNHQALFELYEGARRQRVKRVILASSNHAFGLHSTTRKLRLNDAYRPDCFYGLSKVWGEALGRMYWEKHGIECVALRIGTFMNAPPRNRRELATWLGIDDLHQLVNKSLEAEAVGFAPVWGVSANTRAWVDLDETNAIGYEPKQDAEAFAADAMSASAEPDPVADRYQGGRFVTIDYTPDESRPG